MRAKKGKVVGPGRAAKFEYSYIPPPPPPPTPPPPPPPPPPPRIYGKNVETEENWNFAAAWNRLSREESLAGCQVGRSFICGYEEALVAGGWWLRVFTCARIAQAKRTKLKLKLKLKLHGAPHPVRTVFPYDSTYHPRLRIDGSSLFVAPRRCGER
ncbi:hypothetical protein V9T40_014842 [Parthenolecanium corni]|uniref:Uncharacterized protein n=1 Tax=Parthenolecanium corni TaxID=536013 RepID=A0AAN9T3D0_9HEMI